MSCRVSCACARVNTHQSCGWLCSCDVAMVAVCQHVQRCVQAGLCAGAPTRSACRAVLPARAIGAESTRPRMLLQLLRGHTSVRSIGRRRVQVHGTQLVSAHAGVLLTRAAHGVGGPMRGLRRAMGRTRRPPRGCARPRGAQYFARGAQYFAQKYSTVKR